MEKVEAIHRTCSIINYVRINVKNVQIQLRYGPVWYDDRIIFYTDPKDVRLEIIQYLYNEGFIRDRRTPYTILELDQLSGDDLD